MRDPLQVYIEDVICYSDLASADERTVRAELAEKTRRERTRDQRAELEHFHARERTGCDCSGACTYSGGFVGSVCAHGSPRMCFVLRWARERYIERRSSMARAMVPASTYSSSPPTGTPRARRVTARPRALSACPK